MVLVARARRERGACWSSSLRADDRAAPLRFAFRTLLIGAIPAYLVMRVGAEWIATRRTSPTPTPAWIGIGYSVADGGLLLLIIMTVLAGLAPRAGRRGGEPARTRALDHRPDAAADRRLRRGALGDGDQARLAVRRVLGASPGRRTGKEPSRRRARASRRVAGGGASAGRCGRSDRASGSARARHRPSPARSRSGSRPCGSGSAHHLEPPAAGALALEAVDEVVAGDRHGRDRRAVLDDLELVAVAAEHARLEAGALARGWCRR